jgi:hypothetical protein
MPTPFDLSCRELLNASPKQTSRHCFKSAFHHLEMADKIKDIDPAMALFRVITAEEEAATGLMHCLKERDYKNSDKLDTKSHLHKSSVLPFLNCLGLFFSETTDSHINKPTLQIEKVGNKKYLVLKIPLIINGEKILATPNPPLNFSISSEGRRLSYKNQIDFYTKMQGSKSIIEHIKSEANIRNTILYAGPHGFNTSYELSPNLIPDRTVKIFALLRAFLLIKPYKEKLPFVQDSLDAFLAMIGSLKNHDLHDGI